MEQEEKSGNQPLRIIANVSKHKHLSRTCFTLQDQHEIPLVTYFLLCLKQINGVYRRRIAGDERANADSFEDVIAISFLD